MQPSTNPTVWERDRAGLEAPPLRDHYSADVCVVGAGIAGMTAACLLAMDGRFVVVLDAGAMGDRATARSTAQLSTVPDAGYARLRQHHDALTVRRFVESHAAAIRQIERLVREQAIRCGFERVDGYLFAPPGQEGMKRFREEEEAVTAMELPEAERVPHFSMGDWRPGPALRIPGQAQIHPLQYLQGLRAILRRRGGQLFGHTPVETVQGGPDGAALTRRGHVVRARHFIIATHAPFNDRLSIHHEQRVMRTYVIAARVPSGSLPHALLWDLEEPPHYLRVVRGEDGGDQLLIGGEDHRAGMPVTAKERFTRLETWAHERFPMIQRITCRWSGQILETLDGMALIGANPHDEANVSIATGFNGMGITHGTLGGMLLRDRILGRPNRWASLYDPARPIRRELPAWVRENGRTLWQYTDYVRPAECISETDIPPGQGAVMRRGLARWAVYRDPSGKYHVCSAICPHLKGVVRWNALEQGWECPCHGARFTPTGELLNGPAPTGLRALE